MLAIKDLSFTYDKSFGQTLSQINMDFDKGNITAIIGVNGSGKSSLMKVLMGLCRPQKGSVYYDGSPILLTKQYLYDYRQDVCIVFQNPDQQLFFPTVEDDVAMSLRNLGYAEDIIAIRVADALEKMQISHVRHNPIQYLSYGQKKRVAIAGILTLQPKYLLLDEPTAGLDPAGRKQMLYLIQSLADKGTKIIITSHDMDLIYDSCDYAYVMNEGRIVLEGSKKDVFLHDDLLDSIGLSAPWIVKLHKALNTSLYQSEEEFFKQIGGK